MRRFTHYITRSLVPSLAMASLVGGTVLAQRAPTPPPPPPVNPADAAGAMQPGQGVAPEKDVTTMTPQQMLEQAKQDDEKNKAALVRLEQMQQKARDQNDIIKLNCLNDLVVQVKAAMNIGDQALVDLQDAIARRDEGARGHAFTKHTIVAQKVDLLTGEAGSCVGQDVAFVGETNVTVYMDPSLAAEDFARVPLPRFIVDRPPEASPFI